MPFCGIELSFIVQIWKGFIIFLAILAYHAFSFIALLSLSIGASVAFSNIYSYFEGNNVSPQLETLISIFVLCTLADITAYFKRICLGQFIRRHRDEYEICISHIPMLIYISLLFVCMSQLYAQFEAVHVLRENNSNSQNRIQLSSLDIFEHDPLSNTIFGHSYPRLMNKSTMSGTKKNSSWRSSSSLKEESKHNAIFLLALSYLSFFFSHILKRDYKRYRRIHQQGVNPFMDICLILCFAFVHILIVFMYSFPLICMELITVSYDLDATITFYHIEFVALIIGGCAGLFEFSKPWPVDRNREPMYYFENNARARAMISPIFLALVHTAYFYPLEQKVKHDKLSGRNINFLFFCFCVALGTIQYARVTMSSIIPLEILERRNWNARRNNLRQAQRLDRIRHRILINHNNNPNGLIFNDVQHQNVLLDDLNFNVLAQEELDGTINRNSSLLEQDSCQVTGISSAATGQSDKEKTEKHQDNNEFVTDIPNRQSLASTSRQNQRQDNENSMQVSSSTIFTDNGI